MPPRRKSQANRSGGRKLIEAPLTEYENDRIRHCLSNNARLQQLGIPQLAKFFASTSISPEKTKSNNQDFFDPEYNPEEDVASQEDLSDDNLMPEEDALQELESTPASSRAKELLYSKKITKRTATMPPGGVRPRPAKRILAEEPPQEQTGRFTRSKKNYGPQDIGGRTQGKGGSNAQPVRSSEIPMRTACEADTGGIDNHIQEDEVGQHRDCHNEGEVAAEQTQNSVAQPELDAEPAENANEVAQPDELTQNDILTDAESEDLQRILGGETIRGDNMGKALERKSRSKGAKLPVIIEEGRIRPQNPMIAAKFATVCYITARNHVPVFTHWKEYRKHPGILKDFIGKVGANFNMDITAEPVKKACAQMMKNAVRQHRHDLKEYFDDYPLHLVRKTSPLKFMTDGQWNDLVEGWKDKKKMETCEKNKINRGQVKFHQTTGSRSFEIHCENLGDKYKDVPPTALDLFKECHYSKKKNGYTPTVENAISRMETKLTEPVEDGQQPKTVTEAVQEVLSESTKKSKFLQNVGIQPAPARSIGDLQAQLAMEKRGSTELRNIVHTQRQQIDELAKKLQEAEEARAKQDEENKKKQADTDAKLQLLMALIPQSHAAE